MNGAKNYGINMLKKLSVISTAILLHGCGIMPGMDNLNITQMQKHIAPERIAVHPTLIPISPTLIADQCVSRYFYHVAPSDVLHITVWQHPEFMLEIQAATNNSAGVQGGAGLPGYLVNSNGDIYFPLIGYVHVADQTVDQIRVDITNKLKKYVPNPQVNVRVADFRGQKVYVLGEVNKNGFLPITDQPLSLADALSLSGWLNPDTADPRYIYVIRGDFTHPQIFWLNAKTPDRLLLAERFSLQPRDILYVSSAPATRWNRVLNQILPTVQAVWYTQAVVKNA
jgi:polysaccharide biosynthesis/export protein